MTKFTIALERTYIVCLREVASPVSVRLLRIGQEEPDIGRLAFLSGGVQG